MSDEISITLRAVRFDAFIGVMDQERRVGNEFVVDLTVHVAVTEAMLADDIEGTVSYADLYEVVKEMMNRPAKTLEYVAITIAKTLRQRFPAIKNGEIALTKVAPPIPGIDGSAAVTYRF